MGGMKKQKVMRAVALGGALMAVGGSAMALGTGDGAEMLKTCESVTRKTPSGLGAVESFQAGYCVGALDAAFSALVIEAAEARRPDTGVCPKDDSGDRLLLVKVVMKYLKENPQTHSQPAEIAVRAALRKAFPCR